MHNTKHRTIPINVTTEFDSVAEEVIITVSSGEVERRLVFSIQEYNRLKDWNEYALKDKVSTLCHHVSDAVLLKNLDMLKIDAKLSLEENACKKFGGH